MSGRSDSLIKNAESSESQFHFGPQKDNDQEDKRGTYDEKEIKEKFGIDKEKIESAEDDKIKDSIEEEAEDHDHKEDKEVIPEWIQYVFIFSMYVLIFFIANTYQNIKIIFSLLGSTIATLISFILPSMFYVHYSEHNFLNWYF